MKSERHQISRNAKWAIAQTIISAFVLFFLYRFLLKELGPEKLGLWSLILASTSLARVGELGFSTATLRFVGKYVGEGSPQNASEIVETSLLTISLPFLLLAVVAIPFVGSVLPWFVPVDQMADALIIVPWAMLALWLGVTSGLIQSAIDGCGRVDQRNKVLIATNVVYLALTMLLAPTLGLKGVAIAQAIQAGATLLIMWWLIRLQLKPLPWLPYRWRKLRFSEIAEFALTMQIGGIADIFVEPITKALISRFGGLEFVAYYEMANQVIKRARSVLISGFQAITPQFAATEDVCLHRQLFIQSQQKIVDLGIPFMTLVIIGFPVLSQIWIGHSEATFIISGQILGFTWLLVTLLMPAYFFLAGTGLGLPLAIAQNSALVGAATIGWIAGYKFGGLGTVVAASLSLLLGNIYMYSKAANALFRIDNVLNMPEVIFGRLKIGAGVCLLVVGLNYLSLKYINNLMGCIAIFGVFAFSLVGYGFITQKSK